MFTIYKTTKEQADRTYKECGRCEGRVACPESTCMWAGMLANDGMGKVYCTAPDMPEESRKTRFGM